MAQVSVLIPTLTKLSFSCTTIMLQLLSSIGVHEHSHFKIRSVQMLWCCFAESAYDRTKHCLILKDHYVATLQVATGGLGSKAQSQHHIQLSLYIHNLNSTGSQTVWIEKPSLAIYMIWMWTNSLKFYLIFTNTLFPNTLKMFGIKT